MERVVFTGRPLSGPYENADREATLDSPRVVSSDGGVGDEDRMAFRGLLAFTLVLFFRPQDSLPFLEPLHFADVTATFAMLTLIAGRVVRRAAVSRLTPELVLVLALGGLMLATAPFSVWPGGALGVFTTLYLKVIVVFALIVNTVTTRARLIGLVTVIMLGTAYVAVGAVGDYFRGVNLIEGARVGGGLGGLFGNPNDMALNMVTFLPFVIAIALMQGRRLLRAVAIGAVPVIAAAIVFSQSRGGVLGLLAMLLVLLYRLQSIRPNMAVLVLVVSVAVVPLLPASYTERMSSIFNAEQDPTGSREARRLLMREGYRAFLDNPVFGIGAGQFVNYLPDKREVPWIETHNAVLQVASELGMLGLVVFVLLVFRGFAAAFRGMGALSPARPPPLSDSGPDRELALFGAALVASLTGWLAAAMFASVAYYWTFYLVLGLAVAFADISAREANNVVEPDREGFRTAGGAMLALEDGISR
jgi:O-antigen ligase